MNQRHATLEEWNAIIAKARKGHAMVAKSLAAGASYTENGVKLLPPIGFVRTPTTIEGPEVETIRDAERDAGFVSRTAPTTTPADTVAKVTEDDDGAALAKFAADGVKRSQQIPSGLTTKTGQTLPAAEGDLAALLLNNDTNDTTKEG